MLFNFLKQTRAISIVCHAQPDLDTLCAAVSLKNILSQTPLTVHLVCQSPIDPKFKDFIYETQFSNHIPSNTQKVVVLDCSSWQRTKLKQPEVPILNLDHHNTNTNFGDYNYVIKTAASTCEMLAEIYQSYNINLSPQTAQVLINGVYSDTKSLTTCNVSSNTLRICSWLAKLKANVKIAHSTNKTALNSTELKELGLALLNTKIDRNQIAISSNNAKHSSAYLDKAIELIDQIPNKKYSILLSRNHKGLIRASMRNNKGEIDVSKIAAKFNGGGHKKAAGFVYNPSKLDK